MSESRVSRLAWATDVHLNFLSPDALSAFCRMLREQPADGLVLTGDIAEGPTVCRYLSALSAQLMKPLFFVLGNHDYYRSSIGSVRTAVTELCDKSPWLKWLPAFEPVELTPSTALLGVDGWGDARIGDFARSTVMLNDYVCIEELAHLSKAERCARLQELGAREAATLLQRLSSVVTRYPRVIVATHVPPFREACWHEGKLSDDDWLPHFTCRATGEVLLRVAAAHPNCCIVVLCGHTHGEGVAQVLENLTVVTGAAEYGQPRVQRIIEVDRPLDRV